MILHLQKFRTQAFCCLFSVAAHLLVMQALGFLAHYDFASAVGNPSTVMVDLADPGAAMQSAASDKEDAADAAEPPAAAAPQQETTAQAPTPAHEPPAKAAPAEQEAAQEPPQPEQKESAETESAPAQSEAAKEEPASPAATAAPQPHHAAQASAAATGTNLSAVTGFVGGAYEKLIYRITMHGLPIGTAELESKNVSGITTITLRVKSSPAISSFYPVDDLVETQQISGLYVMAKIKQQEGKFRSDETFTINQRTRTVKWYDLVHPRIMTTTVPNNQVMDSLSGIYYLRARALQVGKTETLHIYDAETYAEVPVEILRKEELRLANLKKVPTVVVRPLQKTAGIFRRTGDLLIWMTDDKYKVPVRIDTAMALGNISAQLISSENRPDAKAQN